MANSEHKVSRTEAEVLAILAKGDRFGLQLVDDSQGRIKRGSVYVLLGRLEEKGMVSSREESRPAVEGGLPRRIYRLTALGKTAMRAWERDILALLGRAV